MAHRGLLIVMLLLAVANCEQWVYTLPTDGSLAEEIFTGFTGTSKNTQVQCGQELPLKCGDWTIKTTIVEDLSAREKWEGRFRSAIADILDECKNTPQCRAVNFDWVTICSSPGLHLPNGGLIDCMESNDDDYVGIGIAYQQLTTADVSYIITLSSSENYWQKLGRELCIELWKQAGLPAGTEYDSKMYEQYMKNRKMHQLYDFAITGTTPLKPACSSNPQSDCPTAPGGYATVDVKSNWLSSSEDCKAQDFGKIAGLGYNIIMGSPMAQDDEGYKASPVFKPSEGFETIESTDSKDGCPLWKYKYPKGYSVQQLNKLNAATSTGDMFSEQSYQQSSMSRVSASVQGSYLGVSAGFTGSADFKSFSQDVQSQKMVEIRQFQESPAFISSVHLFDLEFSDDYLKSLAAAYKNNGAFDAFIESYGTHIATSVTSGARFSQVSTFTSDNYETLKANSEAFEIGMTASYAGVSGSASASDEKTQQAKAAFEGKRESMKLLSVGANHEPLDFSKENAKEEYVKLAHQNPEILSSTVFPHSKLIQQRWDDIEKAIPNVDKAKFFDYYAKFINDYCGALPSKCMASPGDPPKAMTLDWDMPSDSEMAGSTDCSNSACKEIKFRGIPNLQMFKDSLTISKIQMQCKDVGGLGTRVAAIKFHLSDYSNDLELIALGNQDTSREWDVDEDLQFSDGDRVISVQMRGGADLDYIQFSIKNSKGEIREVHCGGNGGTEVTPISLAGFQLLDYAGYQDTERGYIRAVQFRKFKFDFKSKSAIQQFQSKRQAENQEFYQSLISDGKAMASQGLHSSSPQAALGASPQQNLQAKGHAHGMWEKIENFEEKFQRVEETVGKIVDVLHKIEHCAHASNSPAAYESTSSSYSRSPDRDQDIPSSHQSAWA